MIGNQTSGKQNTLLETNPCYCKPGQTSLVECSGNSGNNASGNHIIGNYASGNHNGDNHSRKTMLGETTLVET